MNEQRRVELAKGKRLLREGYSEQLFLLTNECGEKIVRKQAKPGIKGSLRAEIAWLEELPPSLHRYFPQVLRSNKEDSNGETIFYDMPYFGQGWVLFSELILPQTPDHQRPDHQRPDRQRPDHQRPDHQRPDHQRPDHQRPDHQRPDHKVTLVLIAQVMQVMFGDIFPTAFPAEEPDYPHRLVFLLERCAQQICQLPVFSRLILAEAVTVNGVKLDNVFPVLDLVKNNKRVREKLRPAGIRKVHGDLHPENILVYVPSLTWSVPQVIMLDPIAPLGLSRGDFAMDIAKFSSWLSAELLALRLGLFSLHEEQGGVPAFELTLHTDDTQLYSLSNGLLLHEFVRLVGTAGWARAICDADPQWRQRVSFYQALYALSMVPLVSFPQGLARFLTGLRHLNDFMRTA